MKAVNTVYSALLLFGHTAISQEIHLKSKQDQKSIPFATITYMRNDSIVGGTYSNDKGIAQLDLKKKIDKIVVSHLEFLSRNIDPSNIDTLQFYWRKNRLN